MRTQPLDGVDYYAELGVPPEATAVQIAARYRSLVKALHPDTRPSAPAADERFRRVTAAYRVLGDANRRRDYDVERSRKLQADEARTAAATAHRRDAQPSRRGARWMTAGGVASIVLGLAATVLIVSLQRHDTDLRDRGIAVTATVVEAGNERQLEFTTATGQVIRAAQPVRSGTGEARAGDQVRIRYDPDRPTEVITSDDTVARDITLWIVAVKLLVVGALFVGWGAHRLHRAQPVIPR